MVKQHHNLSHINCKGNSFLKKESNGDLIHLFTTDALAVAWAILQSNRGFGASTRNQAFQTEMNGVDGVSSPSPSSSMGILLLQQITLRNNGGPLKKSGKLQNPCGCFFIVVAFSFRNLVAFYGMKKLQPDDEIIKIDEELGIAWIRLPPDNALGGFRGISPRIIDEKKFLFAKKMKK